MRGNERAYAGRFNRLPRKPYTVEEVSRERGGRRTDTVTSSLRYAIDRREELRRSGRPARVLDLDGRRVEVARWF